MPVLAGWLTGEQVPQEVIEQTLAAMGEVLAHHGGTPAHSIYPGAGLIAFADTAYAQQQSKEPPVLDWVPDRRTLVYRRPLSGIHPLFYIENWPAEGNLIFASEMKALFAVGAPRRLHMAALDALWRYGSIPAPWTAFKDIQVVPAGSILRWQHTKTVVNPASDFALEATAPSADTLEQLDALLNQASHDQLPPHEQVVALLNGSRASSLAAVLSAKQKGQKFASAALGASKTLTTKGWKEVQAVADTLDLPLLAITAVDRPEFWQAAIVGLEAPCRDSRPLAIHQLLHTSAVEAGARIAISGLGAQTLLGATTGQIVADAARDPLTSYRQPYSHQLIHTEQLWSSDVKQMLHTVEAWEDTLHARKLQRRAQQYADRRHGLYYLDLHLRLPNELVYPFYQLATQERMAIRSPYLNAQVMASMIASSPLLNNDPMLKTTLDSLLLRYVSEASRSPNEQPLTIPIASLARDMQPGHELFDLTLAPAAIQQRNIFNPELIKSLQQRALKERAASRALIFIFTTQLFCQIFGIEEIA
ncbi:hypothetical protein [Dictyobacter aurantiacus]|uniref:asparagine synthase (glutamine-hydrolyzing) n=1 Tax=Dictyobacter aurantiacus TaxID=1936993 RepID=A0A401ZA53_9CHLR|nr:hypothetical protein [Dictyobacter aurantiacus]GCE03686.1 hypothetical protein KDAU_10150 [Dictyobacter aurantiacus]